MARAGVTGVGLAVLLAWTAVTRVSTQTAGPPQDIMPALLAEVRGLRAAMEQMATSGARVQLALGRLQLQEQRLNTMIGRLDDTRRRLAETQRSALEQQEQMAMMEAAMKEESARGGGPSRRPQGNDAPPAEQLEEMRGHFKRQIERTTADLQRLTAEEASLAAEVANEQARWSGFNQRLEELERTLGGR